MKDIYFTSWYFLTWVGRKNNKKPWALRGPVAGLEYGEEIKEKERKNGSCAVEKDKAEEAKAVKNWLM